ncbi:MGMT family protein, partial [Treponema porcinum]|uniref:MGMT family protein n=2 Tax=Treponema porcinum TaxID=261392 RepID=UPI0023578C7F
RKSSSLTPMILPQGGKVGSRRTFFSLRPHLAAGVQQVYFSNNSELLFSSAVLFIMRKNFLLYVFFYTGSLMISETDMKIYDIVRQIPAGKVATYGTVAELAGNRRWAQAVGNALHRNPAPFSLDGDNSSNALIPCHRVVSADGRLAVNFGAGGIQAQAALLERENVRVVMNTVDLELYAWNPAEGQQL